jgi:hypothetical protein
MHRRRRTLGLVAAFLGLGLAVAVPAAAHADTPTSIAFTSQSSTVEFGGDWVIGVTVSTAPGLLLDQQSGTVEVQVEGVPGVFASVPVFEGGDAFVSQPVALPPLGSGEHRFTAVFRPAAGSGLVTSQTPTPYVLTVTPLAIEAHAELVEDTLEGTPSLELSLSGSYVDSHGTPPGSWAVSGTDGDRDSLSTTIEQDAGSDPASISLADTVRPGRTLTITAVFTPDASIAGGVEVTQPATVEYTADPLTALETLQVGVPLPWWLVALIAIVVLGLVAALIVVLVRRRRPAPVAEAPTEEAPGEGDALPPSDEP